MRHLPIKIKLILGFAAVGIITLFVGLTGWLGLWHLKGILREINGVRLPGIVGVAELQGHMWAIQRFERVLLYEQDPEIIKKKHTQLLKRPGYKVLAMTSSLEALESCRARPHRFDLVITDQTMPHMTGIHMAEELLRIRPGLPIILCTGFKETILREEVLARGLRDLVAQPLNKAELAKIIRMVLEGRMLSLFISVPSHGKTCWRWSWPAC